MSNLLNELSVTMKEIVKAETRLRELELEEIALSKKILSSKEAKNVLIEEGVIVGAEVMRYHQVPQMFTLSSMPIFAHEINFDEPENESKNPFKVGDEVYYISGLNKSKKVVSHVVGNAIKIDGSETTYHHSFFSFS